MWDSLFLGKNLLRRGEQASCLGFIPSPTPGITTHLIGESRINLLLQLLLDVRVSGQFIHKEGERTASGLVASKNKNNTLGHKFFIGQT